MVGSARYKFGTVFDFVRVNEDSLKFFTFGYATYCSRLTIPLIVMEQKSCREWGATRDLKRASDFGACVHRCWSGNDGGGGGGGHGWWRVLVAGTKNNGRRRGCTKSASQSRSLSSSLSSSSSSSVIFDHNTRFYASVAMKVDWISEESISRFAYHITNAFNVFPIVSDHLLNENSIKICRIMLIYRQETFDTQSEVTIWANGRLRKRKKEREKDYYSLVIP